MIASHFGSVVLLQQQQLGRCGFSFVLLLGSILQSFIKGATLNIDNLSIQKDFLLHCSGYRFVLKSLFMTCSS